MTSTDSGLDTKLLFRDNPLILYRLTRRKYADSLSRLGSAMYPGRWNGPVQEAIYTSFEPAACVLERLVHTPKDRIPRDLAMMKIGLRGDWRRERPEEGEIFIRDQISGAWVAHARTRRSAEDIYNMYFARGGPTQGILALCVPSVLVPVWNVVLYPGASRFWEHVSLLSVEPFDYDPRLFPEGTPWEDESK